MVKAQKARMLVKVQIVKTRFNSIQMETRAPLTDSRPCILLNTDRKFVCFFHVLKLVQKIENKASQQINMVEEISRQPSISVVA